MDPLRGWLYAPTGDQMLVLTGQTLQVLRSMLGSGSAAVFGLSLEPAGERLYIGDGSRVHLATASPGPEE